MQSNTTKNSLNQLLNVSYSIMPENKSMENGTYHDYNRLNNLTGKEWIKFQKSWFIVNPKPRQKNLLFHQKRPRHTDTGEQSPPFDGETPSLSPRGDIPPGVFLPRSCSSDPPGRCRQATPRKQQQQQHDCVSDRPLRSPPQIAPSDRHPGRFYNPFGLTLSDNIQHIYRDLY